MADLKYQDRLQPALLDRLREDGIGSAGGRVMSVSQLREAVLRDLRWLLNANSMDAVVDLTPYPEVRTSVVNYGMPDLSGCLSQTIDLSELAKRIRQSIIDFEPRLSRKSIKVRAESDSAKSSNHLVFDIEAELWAEPVPIHLYLRTDVDLESGEVALVESSGAD